ncbi:MAG: TonB-dependent receptor [Proteiniphilum sp.]|uniref:SusC/RagA family TonB-linked outer membrane protein n=1 Tax=Proteiniphilum sp. TaxID=1926877 RepID=UPI002ABBACAC|nr:TonB-dependent receptor [Proteiniphilum sp.]MDY9917536.1 TonB-dependent receptor [Proteiniphilum sp.]
MKRKLTMFLALFFIGIGLAVAQTQVRGTVVDEAGEPVIGATIQIKGTSQGTVSDIDGNFNLSAPAGGTLVISYVGYQTQEVPVSANVSVQLSADSELLDEVVVVGYGTTTRRAFTGAASSVSNDLIENKIDINPVKALAGTVPGLQMNVGSGQPGAPANIFIRGRNSVNSGTQPLYVIDGVPFETGIQGMRQSEGQQMSPLATISAQDIESVTVLKDASATSIYGARAANGVIVITTKKGKRGLNIDFTARVGTESMPSYTDNYKLVDADTYRQLSKEALLNGYNYASTVGRQSNFQRFNDAYGLGLPYNESGAEDFFSWYTEIDYDSPYNTDWLKEVTRTGLIQNYTLTLNGGGETATAARYYTSVDYFDTKAIVRGKDMKRYSFRFNFDQAPTEKVAYGFNSNVAHTITNMGAGGGYFSDPITQAIMQSPLSPVYNEDGTWNFNTINGYNPVAQRSELGDKSEAKQYRFIFSPYVTYKFIDELSFTSRLGVDGYLIDEFGTWSFLQPQGKDMRGLGENGYRANFVTTITNTLNYGKNFDGHNLDVLLGQEGQKTNYKGTYLAGSNYPVDYLEDVELAATPGSASTTRRELVLNSYFSRAEYNYNEKYYLSGSFRMDGSSRFSKENRWAPFWSAGAKYRISSENFMQGIEWLDDLTVRASYGTSGNQTVGNLDIMQGWYASRNLYDFGYNYNGQPGSNRLQIGNSSLKWERTAKFNVGLDVMLFNFLTVSADYYKHRTKDMVFGVPLSRTTGMSSSYLNVGELENQGVEFSIMARLFNRNDFSWNVTLNGSHNKNEIIKLSTDNPIEYTYQIVEPGKDYYTFKMKEWAGVDPETGVGMWYLNEEGDETTTNYNAAKKRYVGKATPDFQGGLTNNLQWKGFDMSFQINFSVGGKIYGNHLRYDEQIGNSFGSPFTKYVAENRWQKPGDIAKVPMLMFTTGVTENSHSSRFLMDGSYVKFRSLSLGYTLPNRIVSNIGLSKTRLFFNAENLFTIADADYRGFDPGSVDANGVQWWNYPTPRSFVFGLTLGF